MTRHRGIGSFRDQRRAPGKLGFFGIKNRSQMVRGVIFHSKLARRTLLGPNGSGATGTGPAANPAAAKAKILAIGAYSSQMKIGGCQASPLEIQL